MNFGHPLWIIIGVICTIGLYFLVLHFRHKRLEALEQFAAKNLLANLTRNVSQRKRNTKTLFYLAALFCLFIALARPQFGYQWIDVKRKGIDILFAIDTSRSMLAEDIRPNRLERSKFAILDFVGQLEGDRIGLMPFAGSAFLMCPLTIDYSAFEQSLQAIDTEIIPNPGTNIAQAIEYGEKVLQNDANYKLLIIITDGENLQGDTIKAVTQAAEEGMRIFTVGVGTAAGELIPFDNNGQQEFIKDPNGKFVTSKLDETTLKKIAEKSDGLYVPLGDRGQGLETIYQEKLALIPKEELAEKRHKVPIERFQWALAAALFFLVVEFLLNSRKTRPFTFTLPKRIGRKTHISPLILISLLFLQPLTVKASPGEDAYRAEDYLTASQYYEEAIENEPDNPALHFNYGATAYKNNMYDEAITSFNKALQSSDLQLQERAYYNRGTAQYRKGEESLQADSQKTIKNWQDSLASYDSCLKLQPENENARFNHDLIQKKLEELKKQEQQKKQSEQNEQENTDDNQKKQEQGEQSQDQQTPADSGEEEKEQNLAEEQQKEEEQEAATAGSEETEPEDSQEEQQSVVPGKLSKEEAEQLLNELRDEEGHLNFIPKGIRKPDNNSGRDW